VRVGEGGVEVGRERGGGVGGGGHRTSRMTEKAGETDLHIEKPRKEGGQVKTKCWE